MSESIDTSELGLLPYEREFILGGLVKAIEQRDASNLAYGDAVGASGGDWALDDPGALDGAQKAHINDVRVGWRKAAARQLEDFGELDYPEENDEAVGFGSLVSIRTQNGIDQVVMGTRKIPGHTEINDVDIATPGSPLGPAIMGRKVGDQVKWDLPNGRHFEGTIIEVDQKTVKSWGESDVEG